MIPPGNSSKRVTPSKLAEPDAKSARETGLTGFHIIQRWKETVPPAREKIFRQHHTEEKREASLFYS